MREENVYVLRLWRDGDAPQDWRYSLEALGGDERRAFTTLEALFDFVSAQLGGELAPKRSR